MRRSAIGLILLAIAASAACSAASSQSTPGGPQGNFPGGDGPGDMPLPPPRPPDITNDGAAFGVGTRESEAGTEGMDAAPRRPTDPDSGPDATSAGDDGGADATPPDAGTGDDGGATVDASPMDSGVVGPPGACPGPLGAGD